MLVSIVPPCAQNSNVHFFNFLLRARGAGDEADEDVRERFGQEREAAVRVRRAEKTAAARTGRKNGSRKKKTEIEKQKNGVAPGFSGTTPL